MKQLKKEDISQDIFDLYDDYAHNKLNRRQFVEKLSIYAVGGISIGSLLSFMSPNYIDSLLVKPDDPNLDTTYINYDSPKGGGSIKGQLSKPKKITTKLAGVIVVHLGGYPGNDDDGRTLQKKRDRNEMLEDFIAAYSYLKSHKECNGKVGVVGFCFGGWISNMMAVRIPNLGAAVPYYGRQPSDEDAKKIKSPLLLQYGELDTRVNAGWPAFETILKANKIEHQAYIYPEVNHGFHNNTTPRFDKKAADLSWERTIAFFKKHLVI